ncbi:ABC transporter substrate-binding protein [Undibacterium sp. LX40W]|uniref:ABC transporter substrate-binding protein n=2 Tax=Oxalobacteraceae TaxID=75682 RepID=A0A923HT93_9BURK|nr:ABC transporter substrate-binding protein [Undibacterium nitidum]MBC3893201.1 ABC transporter substrate-binding protein [Undibacterium sp. LX40W]
MVTPQLGFAVTPAVLNAITSDVNFPYNFVKDQQVQGLSVDVAKELAHRLGAELKIEVVPWTRALMTAQTQASVMVFTLAKIPEREHNYHWIGPITHSEEWLYKLKRRSDVQVKTIEDARRYLVGDEASNASIPSFAKLGIKVDTAPSMVSNCKKFKLGRVDLIPFDPDGVAAFANECELTADEIEKTVRVHRDTALYFGFGKSTPPELIRRVQKAFSDMVKDKTLNRINKKWKAETTR